MPRFDPPVVPRFQRNDLAYLQLEIARRADELAKPVVLGRNTDLVLWLQAEREIFADTNGPQRRPASLKSHSQPIVAPRLRKFPENKAALRRQSGFTPSRIGGK